MKKPEEPPRAEKRTANKDANPSAASADEQPTERPIWDAKNGLLCWRGNCDHFRADAVNRRAIFERFEANGWCEVILPGGEE